MSRVNLRFIFRALLIAVPLALLLLALGVWAIFWRVNPPIGPLPLPPTILAPRGELPGGPVGLQEWAKYRGEEFGLAGCGFLLKLPDGTVVGVTTAHSLAIADASRQLEQVALGAAGAEGFVVTADAFWGNPGVPRTGDNFTVDYILLKVNAPVDPALVLSP